MQEYAQGGLTTNSRIDEWILRDALARDAARKAAAQGTSLTASQIKTRSLEDAYAPTPAA